MEKTRSSHILLPILALISACGGDEPQDRTDPAPTAATGSPETGGCTADGDCPAGHRCLDSMVPGSDRYCAPPCAVQTAEKDCAALLQGDVTYNVGDANNRWRSKLLARGLYCLPGDAFGLQTQQRFCGFVCPKRAAMVLDADGQPEACACLPNYKAKTGTGKKLLCEVNKKVQCSIFNPCDATKTQKHECSKADFRCAVSDRLEGICVDWVSGQDLDQCLEAKAQTPGVCDVECYAGCGGGELCAKACCGG